MTDGKKDRRLARLKERFENGEVIESGEILYLIRRLEAAEQQHVPLIKKLSEQNKLLKQKDGQIARLRDKVNNYKLQAFTHLNNLEAFEWAQRMYDTLGFYRKPSKYVPNEHGAIPVLQDGGILAIEKSAEYMDFIKKGFPETHRKANELDRQMKVN